MRNISLNLLKIVVLIYSAWQSRELIDAWQHSPLEYGAWISFLIWCSPLIVAFFITENFYKQKEQGSYFLIGAAILLTFFGTIGALNTLNYFGLAFAIASILPLNWTMSFWIPLAVAWMPAYGWFASHYFPNAIFSSRIIISLIVVFFTILFIDRGQNENNNN